MYFWMIFLHLAGVFLFLAAHGTSMAVAFRLRQEHNLDRLRALVELSGSTYMISYLGLLLLLVSGIIAGFMGHWWGTGWIWASLILLIAIIVAMVIIGSNYFTRLRKAIGSPYQEGMKTHPAVEPAGTAEIEALLAQGKPWLLTAIGFGGLLLVTWLMVFKPF